MYISFIVLFLFIMNDATFAQKNYWQQKVDFKIDVTLDPNLKTLNAFEKISYTNNSPDTLKFIWFHLWPNAYKNDKSAFSEQMLRIGRTDFYFSNNEKRGYINRLDFRMNEITLKTEDHPEHIDIIKVWLPSPLPPKKTVTITTPFHVKLPYNFSRGGYNGQTYQITQWFPKPAVYDIKGWHPMPYLDQGEFYSDFGSYEVKISLPENFVVAATGTPQNKINDLIKNGTKSIEKGKKNEPQNIRKDWSKIQLKTWIFKQENVHDFAWFADTSFCIKTDTVKLSKGKIINIQCYYHLENFQLWDKSTSYVKDAIRYHSAWLGDYEYNTVSVVEGQQGFDGGMEYPTITILTGVHTPKELDLLIFHEVGHNWFQGMLASNERKYPWLDEGLNTFYEKKYQNIKYPTSDSTKGISAFMNDPKRDEWLLRYQTSVQLDQPLSTPSDSLTTDNYGHIAYTKGSLFMQKLENDLGQKNLDKAMHAYFNNWKLKHPDPMEFKGSLEKSLNINLDSTFELLAHTGNLTEIHQKYAVVPFWKPAKSYEYKPIFYIPLIQYGNYNGLAVGAILHNYSIPSNKLNFYFVPMFGLKSLEPYGWSRFTYQLYPKKYLSNIEIGAYISRNHLDLPDVDITTSNDIAIFKFAPFIKMALPKKNPLQTIEKYFLIKNISIRENRISKTGTANTERKNNYNILMAGFTLHEQRVLYPYKIQFLSEYNNQFVRLGITANQFFNYTSNGGVNVRFFAGKFFYTSSPSNYTRLLTRRYHLNLTGPKGSEDYAYADLFYSRYDNTGIGSQQMMIRDGAFKVGTDMLSEKIGRSDNWLAASNITADIPDKINPLSLLPIKIKLKLFMDIGTYANLWKPGSIDAKLLYDAGIQIPLFNELIDIFIPLFYSNVYKDYYLSTPGNEFSKRIRFSVNIRERNIKDFVK
ncbi:MAG: M1 family metallopeptidase, partial [Chitinophagaceae bacterium]